MSTLPEHGGVSPQENSHLRPVHFEASNRNTSRGEGTLRVDDLVFDVRLSTRRKTVEIIVDRDGSLIIAAPDGTSVDVLEDFVREKQFWIYSKLAEKEALRHVTPAKEFVSGEGFWYLGRSYRLLLVDGEDERVNRLQPLKLIGGRFRLLRSEADRGRRHFIRWYTARARPWIQRRLALWEPRVGVESRHVTVRELGYRWGSCASDGTLYFHWATILLPPAIVEYVIVHELIHLLEPHHTLEFWHLLERVLPDYEQRKTWLAEHGGKYVVL